MEEKNLFIKLYELFSDNDSISHYEADINYLKKAWNYFEESHEVWEIEQRHVANTLGLSISQFKVLLVNHQNIQSK